MNRSSVMTGSFPGIAHAGAMALVVFTLLSVVAAESVKIEGLITARNGETMTLLTADSPKLIVLLTQNTEVGQVQGLFKARRKEMSMTALIPGLAVRVEGTYDDQHQLVAAKVSFKGDDLKRAQAIQAGTQETQAQAQQNKEGIAAANARFDKLDDYTVVSEVVVYFANGKSKVDSKYTSQLLDLAQKAKSVDGYMVEVKGYSSTVGSATLNQKLSEDRANEVASILIQKGHIPLTRMLAPAAMGESQPVANDKTAEGQAQNRRVVVRVLQNKGVAGL